MGSLCRASQCGDQAVSQVELQSGEKNPLPTYFCYWQNSLSSSCKAEVPISFFAVSRWLSFAPGGCLHSLSCGPSILRPRNRHRILLMF